MFLEAPEVSVGQIWTFTNEMGYCKRMFEVTGAINIAADLEQQWTQVDPEWLLEQNPEVIMVDRFFPSRGGVFGFDVDDPAVAEALRNEIMGMTGFEGSDAGANGRVYLFEGALMVSPRFAVGMAYWAKWLHPDLFAGLDPQAIYQEYLTSFMRIDYDLSEHGVFVYPEP